MTLSEEQVIEGLEKCAEGTCKACLYKGTDKCSGTLVEDALEMIKRLRTDLWLANEKLAKVESCE